MKASLKVSESWLGSLFGFTFFCFTTSKHFRT